MSLCDFCNSETKYSFVCPYCGDRFCSDHRKPENHNCARTPLVDVSEEVNKDTGPVLDSGNVDQITENDQIRDNQNEESVTLTPYGNHSESYTDQLVQGDQKKSVKIVYGIMIVATILSIAFMGSLVYSDRDINNLQQRYDALIEYFSEQESHNQELILQADSMSQQLELLQTELDKIHLEHSDLKNNWDAIFSDNTTYRNHSIDELISWLAIDTTDRHNLSSIYTPLDQSILLSLKAKTQNLRLGIIIIQGTMRDEPIEYVYNIAKIDSDQYVFINPKTDEIWHQTEEIIPNKTWNQGEYTSIMITGVQTIIDPQ